MTTNNSLNSATNPSCSIFNPAPITAVTGDGTVYTIVYPNAIYNNQAIANLSTGTITFPTGGVYLITGTLVITGTSASNTALLLNAVSTAKTYPLIILGGLVTISSTSRIDLPFSQMIHASASDTMTMQLQVTGTLKGIAISTNNSLQVWKMAGSS